jgi:hypothetical protein
MTQNINESPISYARYWLSTYGIGSRKIMIVVIFIGG